MRPILAGDVFALARCVQSMPSRKRRAHCRAMIRQADYADKFRKRFRSLHPLWGNGSLMGRVKQEEMHLRACADFQSREFCMCVGVVLEELERWRAYKARCQSSEANRYHLGHSS